MNALTGEIPAKGDWITHRYSPSLCHIRASTRKHPKKPLQVEIIYSETYPHVLSLAYGCPSPSCGTLPKKPYPTHLLWKRTFLFCESGTTGVWFRGYPSRIKNLLSDFMIHLKLKHCYFMLITALITDLFRFFSTPQYIIRACIDMWMPHLAAMQCSSWVEVTVWGFRTLYSSYMQVVLLHMHCLTFINPSQKVKETVHQSPSYMLLSKAEPFPVLGLLQTQT